jgi:hypothetical protein
MKYTYQIIALYDLVLKCIQNLYYLSVWNQADCGAFETK